MEYGFWIDRTGSFYWGIQLAGAIPVGESVYRLPKEKREALTAWMFK
jgi:hypothetical protein